MPDMKRFLEVNAITMKIVPVFLIAFTLFFVSVFSSVLFMADFSFMSLFMLLIGVGPFVLVVLGVLFLLRKGYTDYNQWWNGLSEAQQDEIRQDYEHAQQVDPVLILGERYAYIRQMGEAIPYEEINNLFFKRARYWSWNMIVTLHSGRIRTVHIPSSSNKELIDNELCLRCEQASGTC